MTTLARPLIVDGLSGIFAADLSKLPAPRNIRRDGQKPRTAAIRQLFRTIGLTGVSVTMSRGSMCYWTYVRIVDAPRCTTDHLAEYHETCTTSQRTCPMCRRIKAARRRLNYVILTAFPDLGDRSDLHSDYHDFMYTLD